MAQNRDLNVNITASSEKFERGMRSASSEARKFERELARQEKQADQFRRNTGRAMVGVGAAILGGLGLATKAAVNWESAWTGVTKTVEGSAEQMLTLEATLRQMARELPATHTEIAAVAQAAGQLGVEQQHVASFTRVMIDLGVSTNLSAEEAATGLARMANIMGTSLGDVDRLGAALVDLGNNSATTESEILQMALRIAGAGRQIGLTEGEVLAFAASLSSVGIEAAAGGSSISRAFITISQAVSAGGKDLEGFAKVAGMSTKEFARLFREDAAKAVAVFVSGLGEVSDSGQDVFKVLEDLGLGELRVRDAFLRLSGASELLTASLDRGNTAWMDNTALLEEAGKRYETTEARMAIAKNNVHDLGITLGQVFLPAVGAVADGAAGMLKLFADMPEPLQKAIGIFAALSGAITLAGGVAILAVPKIVAFRTALDSMGASASRVNRGIGAVGRTLTGGWGIAIAAVTVGLFALAKKQAEAKQRVDALTGSLDEQTGAFTTASRELMILNHDSDRLRDTLDKLGLTMADLILAAEGDAEALRRVNRAISDGRIKLGEYLGASIFVRDALTEMSGEAEGAKSKFEILKEANEQATDASKDHKDAIDEEADALGELISKLEEAAGQLLDSREAQRRWHQAVDDAKKALEENGKTLDRTTEKGRQNERALDDMARAALSQAKAMLENGESQDKVAAKVENARAEFIKVATQMGLSETAAKKLADQLGLIPDEVETVIKVNTAPASAALDAFIQKYHGREILFHGGVATDSSGTQRRGSGITLADGGFVSGPGGPRDDQIPAWLSNGEFVINARDTARHYQLLQQINKGRLPAFADGGIVLNAQVAGLTEAERSMKGIYQSAAGPLAWAASQRGKPYGWGAVGPRAYDCSGFMSAIANVIRGRAPHSRLGATSTFPWGGFTRGPGRFEIGSVKNAGNGIGHMSGTLNGVNVEARGGDGVVVGPGARGSRSGLYRGNVWHLRGYAQGGLVQGDPPFDLLHWRGMYGPDTFDRGGLARGQGAMFKQAQRPERVLSPRQTESFERLVRVLDSHRGGTCGHGDKVTNYNTTVNAAPTIPTERQIATQLDRLDVMHGRR